MRISVCEFLRLKTGQNWFYVNPGHWRSDNSELDVYRSEGDEYGHEYLVYKGSRQVKVLEYFEGLPSNVVRKLNKGKS